MNASSLLTTVMLAASEPHGGGHGASEAVGHAVEAGAQVPPDPTVAELMLFAVVSLGTAALLIGMMLCFYRMLRGPHLADRVLAGDTLSLQVVGLVILLSIRMGTTMFLDGALVVSIVGFASTIAFSQYIAARNKSASAADLDRAQAIADHEAAEVEASS